MGVQIQVKGATELQRTLRQAGADLDELKPVNEKAVNIVLARARQIAPVRSGALRDTLRIGVTKRAGVVRAGNNRKTGVPYAGPIHWGWPKRGIDANPFMTDAAHDTEPQWSQLYERHVERMLDKVKGA